MAKLGGRPGHSAHIAAPIEIQISQLNMTSCHFEECDLDLDQKDEADQHDYQPVFTLHSKECLKLDSWCYYCRAYDDNDQPVRGSSGCDKGLKRQCNANYGDLSVSQQWGCQTTYAIVAGQSEVIAKDCIAVAFNAEDHECTSLDNSDYEVQCVCRQGSGCNFEEDQFELPQTADQVLVEVNKSIRQLRADLRKTIKRYSRSMNSAVEHE